VHGVMARDAEDEPPVPRLGDSGEMREFLRSLDRNDVRPRPSAASVGPVHGFRLVANPALLIRQPVTPDCRP
jgi:hypothetical protein